MEDDLLSTRQAAALLGVGGSSVKRWADEGVLPCVKTLGGHRRFSRQAVLRLKRTAGGEPADSAAAGSTAEWVRRLVDGDASAVAAALAREQRRQRSWWRLADQLGDVLRELGRRWETGELSVIHEHLASANLARALARCAGRIEVGGDAPRALLMTAAGDDHTLGLSLAEPVVREAGWQPRWVGRRAPIDQAVAFVGGGGAELVAVSASVYSTDGPSLAAQAERLAIACRATGAALVLGGEGLWPEALAYGTRLRSFRELHDLLGRRRPR